MSSHEITVLIRALDNPRAQITADRSVALPHVSRVVIIENVGTQYPVTEDSLRVVVRLKTWTSVEALNVYLREHHSVDNATLVLSPECELDDRALVSMSSAIAYGPRVSAAWVLFENRSEPSYLRPRNTCMLWHPRSFEHGERFSLSYGCAEEYRLLLDLFDRCGFVPRLACDGVRISEASWQTWAEKDRVGEEDRYRSEIGYPYHVVAAFRKHLARDIANKRSETLRA